MQSSRHLTKDKGDLALIKVIADLRQHGILCCLPLSEHLPFDLIAVMPDMKTLLRVQVKYRSGTKHGTVLVEFKNNYYDSKKIYWKSVDFSEVDAYAVYIPDVDQVAYFRVDDLQDAVGSLTLRFEPPKNNQRKGVNLIDDFRNPFLISSERTDTIELAPRQRSFADEIALARFQVYLQECSMYPLIPNSMYVPFDLLSISADMQTIERYSVFADTIQIVEHTDKVVLFDENMAIPTILPSDTLEPDMRI